MLETDTIYQGDCIEVMKDIEDNSVDLIVTDPPYHLSNIKPIEDRLKEVIGGFNNIRFPNFNKGNIEVGKYSQLVSILCKSSDLRRFKDASIGIESWIGVPESAIDFNSDIIIRQKEINTSTKSASIEISNSELVNKIDTKESQFVGDFILDFGDSIDFPISDLQGCNFGQLLSGLFAVPISSIGLPCTNDLLSGDSAIFSSDDFVEDIGLIDNTFSESESSPFILTNWRAKNGFILRFDLRGASAELLIADSTNQSDLSSQLIRPKLIRTFAGTGCLSAIFKAVNVSLIFSIADRTYSFYFHLWIPPDCINIISQLASTVKGFMGKEWDCMPTVDYWKECFRVLKDGAFAFVMSAPRQDVLSRMIVNLQDAEFETGFTSIYWTYGQGFPKAMNIAKNISKTLDNIIKKCYNIIGGNDIWNSLNSAKIAENLFQKLKTEVGQRIDLNAFVVLNVQENISKQDNITTVNGVEIQSGEAKVSLGERFIVVENADILPNQVSLNVILVENQSENQTVSLLKTITVQKSALMMECEGILSRIMDVEVSKIDAGKVRSLSDQDINVFCAELIESWKHIILNQLSNIQNYDMTFQMDNAFAMTVITTKSIMECLITSMVNILEKKLKEEIKQYDGSYAGMQVKPAVEVILVVMKPLAEKTFVDQALANGHSVTWLDDGRIPYDDTQEDDSGQNYYRKRDMSMPENKFSVYGNDGGVVKVTPSTQGRFPANLLVSDDVLNDGLNHTSGEMNCIAKNELGVCYGKYNSHPAKNHKSSGSFSRYFDLDAWWSERIKLLPESVQKTFPFIITPKASKAEKNKGCEGLEEKRIEGRDIGQDERNVPHKHRVTPTKNHHPTVKPIKLFSYLITLGSREGDLVLDPFVGSGTSCISAKILNRHYIGIELSQEYCDIANKRIEAERQQLTLSL